MEIDLLYAALIFGFLTGFHCIGMCGPIAISLPLKNDNWFTKSAGSVIYNLGRVVTYSLMGALFGLLGQGFKMAGFQQGLSIAIGAAMILSVLFPLLFKSIANKSPLFPLVNQLKMKLGLLFGKKSYASLFVIGLLNGLLPCGPVYVAIGLSLASGNALMGSFYMTLFGLGTIPIMLGLNLLGNVITVPVRKYIRKLVPVFIIVMGLWFLMKGLGLGIHFVSPPDHKLEVKTEQINR
nr:sulfite exporter TauE/SafE family protein [Bacteroidota bacterium]